MVKKSMLIAIILGVFSGSVLFLFYANVFAQKPTSSVTALTLYDRNSTLLYEGTVSPVKNGYKRAPYAVDLSLRKIREGEHSSSIVTTIDLPLQNYLQEVILENQIVWQQENISDIAIVVVEGSDWDLRAAVGSKNYFSADKSPIDKISFDLINVVSKQACPLTNERQFLVWTTDSQGKPLENNEIKSLLQEKINEFEAQRGGESYGEN